MAEKKQNDVNDETTADEAAKTPEEAVVETPAAEAEETASDAEAPATEPVAEATEALEEPVTPEEPVAESAAQDAPAEPDAAEPDAAESAEVPVAAAEPETAPAETKAPAAASEPAPEAAPAPQSGPKAKRKRVPRGLRPQKTRPKRQKAAERKPMVRLETPEHERGRRQERQGTVVSDAMEKTIVVRVDTVKAHPKYKKVVRRSQRFHVHDEQNQAKAGDVVRIVETRPLSKTKNWRLAEIVEVAK